MDNVLGGATQVSYSTFRQQLKAGNVEQVTVKGELVQGKLAEPINKEVAEGESVEYTDFVTYLPSFGDEELLPLLEAQGVEVETRPETDSSWWAILLNLLPFALMIGLGYMLYNRMQAQGQSIFSIGKSRAQLYERRKERTTFDDVAGTPGRGRSPGARRRRLSDRSRSGRRAG